MTGCFIGLGTTNQTSKPVDNFNIAKMVNRTKQSSKPVDNFNIAKMLNRTKQASKPVDNFNIAKMLNRTSKTGGRPYSDTSLFEVSDYSLAHNIDTWMNNFAFLLKTP